MRSHDIPTSLWLILFSLAGGLIYTVIIEFGRGSPVIAPVQLVGGFLGRAFGCFIGGWIGSYLGRTWDELRAGVLGIVIVMITGLFGELGAM